MIRIEGSIPLEVLQDIYHFYPILFDNRFGFLEGPSTSIRVMRESISVVADGWYIDKPYRAVARFVGEGMLEYRVFDSIYEKINTLRYHSCFDNHYRYASKQLYQVIQHLNPQRSGFDPTYSRYGY